MPLFVLCFVLLFVLCFMLLFIVCFVLLLVLSFVLCIVLRFILCPVSWFKLCLVPLFILYFLCIAKEGMSELFIWRVWQLVLWCARSTLVSIVLFVLCPILHPVL